jgi:hypothetical protein
MQANTSHVAVQYVSLSGYRFRLPNSSAIAAPPQVSSLIIVGLPREQVEITYLRKVAQAWIVKIVHAEVGATGRTQVILP